MTLANRDRVLETSTTTGTGTYTLAGAVTGFQSFAAVGDGNTCHYAAWEVDANGNPSGGWECGLGTYTASGTTLARSSVYASSNSGSAVSWSAGTRRVAVCPQTNGTLVIRKAGGTPNVDEWQIIYVGSDVGTLVCRASAGNNTSGQIKWTGNNHWYFGNVGQGDAQAKLDCAGIALSGDSGDAGIFPVSGVAVLSLANQGNNGSATLRSVPKTPAALAASQNDYNPGVARRYRLATDGSGGKSITGLAISQVDGQECSVVNVSAADAITLSNQDALSTAANRFICTGAANIVLAANEEALLWYDSTTARWRARKI